MWCGRNLVTLAALWLAALFPIVLGSHCDDIDQIGVQLKWRLQPQFAGYVAAADLGFYADECLSVSLRPGGPNLDIFEEIREERAEFGVAWAAQTLQAIDQGEDIMVISQTFHKVGYTMLQFKDTGYDSLSSLKDKTVCVWSGGNELALRANLPNYNISWDGQFDVFNSSTNDIIVRRGKFHMAEFMDRTCDSHSAMTYNELALVLESENPSTGELTRLDELHVIDFNEEGTSFMEDQVFVTRSYAESHGELIVRFLRATYRGWMYARDHVDETVSMFGLHTPHYHWMMNEVNKLLWPAFGYMGYLDVQEMQENADYMLQFNILNNSVNASSYYNDSYTLSALESLVEGFEPSSTWDAQSCCPWRGGSSDTLGADFVPEELAFCRNSVGDVTLCAVVKSEDPDSHLTASSAEAVVMLLFACLCAVVILGLTAVVIVHRDHDVIRAASFPFLLVMSLSALVSLSYVPLHIGVPTEQICDARNWVLGLTFVAFFGSFLLKTYRIFRVFHNSRLTLINLSNGRLFGYLLVMVVVMVLFLAINAATDSTALNTRRSDDDVNLKVTACESSSDWLQTATIIYSLVLICYGAFLAFRVRNVYARFNESKYLGLAIYNMVFVGVVAVPIANGVWDMSEASKSMVKCFALMISGVLSLVMLFVPKLLIIKSYEQYLKAGKRNVRGNPGNTGYPGSEQQYSTDMFPMGSGVTSVDDVVARLRTLPDEQLQHNASVLNRLKTLVDKELRRRKVSGGNHGLFEHKLDGESGVSALTFEEGPSLVDGRGKASPQVLAKARPTGATGEGSGALSDRDHEVVVGDVGAQVSSSELTVQSGESPSLHVKLGGGGTAGVVTSAMASTLQSGSSSGNTTPPSNELGGPARVHSLSLADVSVSHRRIDRGAHSLNQDEGSCNISYRSMSRRLGEDALRRSHQSDSDDDLLADTNTMESPAVFSGNVSSPGSEGIPLSVLDVFPRSAGELDPNPLLEAVSRNLERSGSNDGGDGGDDGGDDSPQPDVELGEAQHTLVVDVEEDEELASDSTDSLV